MANLFINVQHYLNWTYKPVNKTINGSVVVNYVPVLNNNGSYNGSNVRFIIYVQKSRAPTDTDYMTNCTVPNFDLEYLSCAAQMLNMSTTPNISAMYQALINQSNTNFYQTLAQIPNRCSRFSHQLLNPWTCMLTADQLNNTNDSTYYVGVRAVMWNWTLPLTNGSYNSNLSFPLTPRNGGASAAVSGNPGDNIFTFEVLNQACVCLYFPL